MYVCMHCLHVCMNGWMAVVCLYACMYICKEFKIKRNKATVAQVKATSKLSGKMMGKSKLVNTHTYSHTKYLTRPKISLS
jgi:hypothetical protein